MYLILVTYISGIIQKFAIRFLLVKFSVLQIQLQSGYTIYATFPAYYTACMTTFPVYYVACMATKC